MSEEIMKQNQDRRLKPMQGDNSNSNQQQQQQQQPQKCPRCESLNTKFCYYNNYSLSQPRYFCKTCRRYWTQGGTLRNVPVGGGCRKGKRTKTSSTSSSAVAMSSSSAENSRPQTLPLSLGSSQNLISNANSGTNSNLNPNLRPQTSFYSGGGFLNSLAAIQSLNAPAPHSLTLNQNLVGDLANTSNLNLLHGFNAVSPFGSQQQRQYYAAASSSRHHHQQQQNWQQPFMSNTNPILSDTALWSISTTTTTTAGNSNIASAAPGGTFPLNPADHQWHDLPGYGPRP